MLTYYLVFLIVSCLFTLIYFCMLDRRLNIYYTGIQILVPLINLSCYATAASTCIESALMGQKLTYIGGVFLPPLVFYATTNVTGTKIARWARCISYVVAFVLYAVILTCEHHSLFYTALSYHYTNGAFILDKEYGFMHTVVYAVIGIYAFGVAYFLISALITRKNTVSIRTVYLLGLTAGVLILVFFFRNTIFPDADPVVIYTVAQGMFLIVAGRSYKYQVDDVIMDSMNQMGELACITINRHYEYLGSNRTAREWFPELNGCAVDLPVSSREGICLRMYGWTRNVDILKKGIETSYKPENGKIRYRVIVDRIDRHGGYKILIQKAEREW